MNWYFSKEGGWIRLWRNGPGISFTTSKPLFSERYGHRRPLLKILRLRFFRLELSNFGRGGFLTDHVCDKCGTRFHDPALLYPVGTDYKIGVDVGTTDKTVIYEIPVGNVAYACVLCNVIRDNPGAKGTCPIHGFSRKDIDTK